MFNFTVYILSTRLFRLTHLVFFLLLPLLVLSGCEKKSPPKKAPEEAKPVWNGTGEGFRTPDYRLRGQASRNDRKGIEINLKETKLAVIPEDYEKWGNVSFGADGRQVFYQARKKENEFIVVSSTAGQNIGPAYEGISFLAKSPDGRRFAFGGRKGERKHLVVDNKEMGDLYHEEVAPGAFSPDGRFVASEVGNIKGKKWFVVVSDGEKEVYRSPIYPDTYRQPIFSPNGRLLVFELGDDKMEIENKNKKSAVFFLDVSAKKIIKERVYTGYKIGSFSFSSDSSRVIYDVQKEGKNFLVLNDFALNKERKVELPYTSAGRFILSPDGKHIIFLTIKERKQYLVVSPWKIPAQRKESGPYEAISPPVFISPPGAGSNMVAYCAMKGGKWRTVVGDSKGPEYYGIGKDPPVFSPDGAKIAYPAMKDSVGAQQDRRRMMEGKWVMVVSRTGEPAAVKEGPAYDMVITPVFSPDGKYIAYRARTGTIEKAKRFIVIADAVTGKVIKEGHVGDEIWPPVWSADSRSVAYGARIGRELWWKVQPVN